jgi:hypothetical protein
VKGFRFTFDGITTVLLTTSLYEHIKPYKIIFSVMLICLDLIWIYVCKHLKYSPLRSTNNRLNQTPLHRKYFKTFTIRVMPSELTFWFTDFVIKWIYERFHNIWVDVFWVTALPVHQEIEQIIYDVHDSLCGLVIRVPGYRSRGPGSIPGATKFSEK